MESYHSDWCCLINETRSLVRATTHQLITLFIGAFFVFSSMFACCMCTHSSTLTKLTLFDFCVFYKSLFSVFTQFLFDLILAFSLSLLLFLFIHQNIHTHTRSFVYIHPQQIYLRLYSWFFLFSLIDLFLIFFWCLFLSFLIVFRFIFIFIFWVYMLWQQLMLKFQSNLKWMLFKEIEFFRLNRREQSTRKINESLL